MDVFINDVASFLPNKPVSNPEIEEILGKINNIPSKTKRIVLKNNGIKTRYYAVDRDTGKLTHTNAQLTAQAVRNLKPFKEFTLNDISCLCCGTTSGDLLFPGHGVMVLGELGIEECEAVTTAGICMAGMTAFKYAYMNVATGIANNAVATGSELSSSYMRSGFLTPRLDLNLNVEKRPVVAFDADFLRWMLSDGAGAVFLSDKKNPNHISLKVEWIETISFSGQLETCMYAGGVKQSDGSIIGWRDTEAIESNQKKYLYSVRQDIKLLDREIVTTMTRTLVRAVEKYGITPNDVDWYLPHYSSDYFREKFYQGMKEIGFEVPYEKWFTNLTSKGNTGSAAIYIIMEEIFKSGRLKKGEKILCFIPESGRFSHCFMMLTVV